MLCSFWSKYNVKKEYNEATSKSVNFIIVRIIVIFKHIKERIHYISMQHFQLIFPQRALILISADKPAKHFSFLYFSALFFFCIRFSLLNFPRKAFCLFLRFLINRYRKMGWNEWTRRDYGTTGGQRWLGWLL